MSPKFQNFKNTYVIINYKIYISPKKYSKMDCKEKNKLGLEISKNQLTASILNSIRFANSHGKQQYIF